MTQQHYREGQELPEEIKLSDQEWHHILGGPSLAIVGARHMEFYTDPRVTSGQEPTEGHETHFHLLIPILRARNIADMQIPYVSEEHGVWISSN